jgi:hypothetical protein
MAEWSEDHMTAIGSLNLNFGLVGGSWLNWRPGGALRWKVETTNWEGWGVWCDMSEPPRLYPSSMSVKDRWVGPREQVLNVPIAYWCYGPSKPSSLTSTEGGLTPTTSIIGLREKLGMNPWMGKPSCCRLGREPFYSGAVALSIIVDDFVKGCYM